MTIGLFYGIILASNGGFRFNIGWERLTKIRKALHSQCFFDFEDWFGEAEPRKAVRLCSRAQDRF